ncbi:MAG: cupredoxin domain-containing protein [Candidatus Levybacteria bacterium]|nr:cupredoxin domain-containing protein [Candidatus Levybacteria bacterium]
MTEEASPSGAAMGEAEGEVKEFTVEASSFKFNPATITVNKGDTVKITLTNKGGFHDFIIDEFNAKTKQLQAGQSETMLIKQVRLNTTAQLVTTASRAWSAS